MTTEVPSGTISDFSDEIEALLSDLITIQEVTRRPIQLPDRDFTREDFVQAHGLATGLRAGSVPISIKDFSATMGRRGVEQVIDSTEAASLRMALVREETIRLVDTEIPLGPVVRLVIGASVHPREKARLAAALQDQAQDTFEVNVDCTAAVSTAIYLNYLPAEERVRYRSMFPDFDVLQDQSPDL